MSSPCIGLQQSQEFSISPWIPGVLKYSGRDIPTSKFKFGIRGKEYEFRIWFYTYWLIPLFILLQTQFTCCPVPFTIIISTTAISTRRRAYSTSVCPFSLRRIPNTFIQSPSYIFLRIFISLLLKILLICENYTTLPSNLINIIIKSNNCQYIFKFQGIS